VKSENTEEQELLVGEDQVVHGIQITEAMIDDGV
jgi:hypothetical protein